MSGARSACSRAPEGKEREGWREHVLVLGLWGGWSGGLLSLFAELALTLHVPRYARQMHWQSGKVAEYASMLANVSAVAIVARPA